MKNIFDEPKWPVCYNSKLYYEKDCGPIFISMYEGQFQLNWNGCIYLGEEIVLAPDDEMESE